MQEFDPSQVCTAISTLLAKIFDQPDTPPTTEKSSSPQRSSLEQQQHQLSMINQLLDQKAVDIPNLIENIQKFQEILSSTEGTQAAFDATKMLTSTTPLNPRHNHALVKKEQLLRNQSLRQHDIDPNVFFAIYHLIRPQDQYDIDMFEASNLVLKACNLNLTIEEIVPDLTSSSPPRGATKANIDFNKTYGIEKLGEPSFYLDDILSQLANLLKPGNHPSTNSFEEDDAQADDSTIKTKKANLKAPGSKSVRFSEPSEKDESTTPNQKTPKQSRLTRWLRALGQCLLAACRFIGSLPSKARNSRSRTDGQSARVKNQVLAASASKKVVSGKITERLELDSQSDPKSGKFNNN